MIKFLRGKGDNVKHKKSKYQKEPTNYIGRGMLGTTKARKRKTSGNTCRCGVNTLAASIFFVITETSRQIQSELNDHIQKSLAPHLL